MSRFSVLENDDSGDKSNKTWERSVSVQDVHEDKYYKTFNNSNRPYGAGYDRWNTTKRRERNPKESKPYRPPKINPTCETLSLNNFCHDGQRIDSSGNVRDSTGKIIMYNGKICARCYNTGHNSLYCNTTHDAFGNIL